MSKGLDYAWGKPGGANIKKAGFDFVCRYVSNTPSKNLTAAEVQDLQANGLQIVIVWESSAKIALKGAAAGSTDADLAIQQAANLNFPAENPIYFACDFELLHGKAVTAYFDGIAEKMPFAQIGAYGSYALVKYLFDNGLISYGWQTSAWSNKVWDSRIHIKQVSYNYVLKGVNCDVNESVQDDFGQW